MGDEATLGEIRDLLQSINAKLPPRRAAPQPVSRIPKLGRVFSAGQTIPDDVDLVTTPSGIRVRRVYDAMQVPLDQWVPRDIEGPVLSANQLLNLNGHVTEIPAPDEEAQR